jgi:hypothetical protein
VLNRARQMDVFGAAVSDVHAHGAAGGRDLAELVVAAADQPSQMKFFYPDDISIREKIETLARDVYRAESVEFLPEARRKMKLYEELGYGRLPICMAKTHLSLSHDANLKGVPQGYVFPVGCRPGPASSTPWLATCKPCPGWARSPPPRTWTSTPTAISSACFSLQRVPLARASSSGSQGDESAKSAQSADSVQMFPFRLR